MTFSIPLREIESKKTQIFPPSLCITFFLLTATEFWEKLTFPTPTKPMPRAQTTAFILSQFKTRGAVHYLGLSEQNYCGSQPDPEKRTIITKDSPVKDSEALYEEIDDCKVNSTTVSKDSNTYTFNDPDNCLLEEEEEIGKKHTCLK